MVKFITMGALALIPAVAVASPAIEFGAYFGERNLTYSIDSSSISSDYGSPTSKLVFDSAPVSGLVFAIDRSGVSYFDKYTIYLGKGISDSGIFDDKDWYSNELASDVGRNPLFSHTVSDLKVSLDAKINHEAGNYYYGFMGIDRVGIGLLSSLSFTEFDAYGLEYVGNPYIVSSGRDFDIVPSKYSAGTNVLSAKQYSVETSIQVNAKQSLYDNWFVEGKLNLTPVKFLYTEDYHHLRDDLHKPSIVFRSLNYGASGEVSLGYKYENYTARIAASGYVNKDYAAGSAIFDFVGTGKGATGFDSHFTSGFEIYASISKEF